MKHGGSSADLRPLILDEYGIIQAIEYLVCENKEQSGMQIDFDYDVHFKSFGAAAGKRSISHRAGSHCQCLPT